MAAAAAPVPKQRAVVPRHIAVIMDGNRRFGRDRFADPLKGHEEGGRVRERVWMWVLVAGLLYV